MHFFWEYNGVPIALAAGAFIKRNCCSVKTKSMKCVAMRSNKAALYSFSLSCLAIKYIFSKLYIKVKNNCIKSDDSENYEFNIGTLNTCPVNIGVMVVPMILLDGHILINGISCRERADALRIDRIVVETKMWNISHFFINSVNIGLKILSLYEDLKNKGPL